MTNPDIVDAEGYLARFGKDASKLKPDLSHQDRVMAIQYKGTFIGDNPKRFVDLLAEGVEFIKYNGLVYTIRDSYIMVWDGGEWRCAEQYLFTHELLKPATPAQNPEKKGRTND